MLGEGHKYLGGGQTLAMKLALPTLRRDVV